MIYVDLPFIMKSRNPGVLRVGILYGHVWCHMWTDGPLEELHTLAVQIGMRRSWFQPDLRRAGTKFHLPHYDLAPPLRERALRRGAVEIPLREWLRRR